MDELALHWTITLPGSAMLRVNFSHETVEVHTTYIGDGLGSIVRAAVDLKLGSSTAIAFLPAEPGGTCLFFTDAGEDVYLQIVRFVDMQSESGRWSGGSLLWHGRVGVGTFVDCVAQMADSLLVRSGGSGAFAELWGGIPFPVNELKALRDEE